MKPLTLGTIATIVGGQLRNPSDANHPVTGIDIDSRIIKPGDLFVPIVAERDGHDFVSAAIANGASGYFCAATHSLVTDPNAPAGAILVDDPLAALTQLGQWHRDTINPTVVCVTGSNGKTTTKDFIAAALSPLGEIVATKGSFNNEIGMPLTLCALTDDTEVLVSEVGARGIGHIAAAMPMLRPDIAVVTTIGDAHVGEFGSEAAIVQAKGELVEALAPSGLAILNADNPACAGLALRTNAPVITVGRTDAADLHPQQVVVTDAGVVVLTLDGQTLTAPLPGVHQTTNLLAAIAVADALKIPREASLAALAHAEVSPMRMAMSTVGHVTIINDAYNANEGSMVAALDTLAAMQTTQRIAVLGFIHELGEDEATILRRIAKHSETAGIDTLIGVNVRGQYAAGRPDTIEVSTVDEALQAVLDTLTGDPAVVLVKASRAEGLEQLVTALTTHLEQAA